MMLSSYIILCFKKSCAGFFKQLATAYGLFTTPIAIFIVNKIYESTPGAHFLQTNLTHSGQLIGDFIRDFTAECGIYVTIE